MSDPIYVFPIRDLNDHPGPLGLTLRDAFAMAAMQGMLAGEPGPHLHFDNVAAEAYLHADAMLKARAK